MMINLLKGAILTIDLHDQACSFECWEGRVWITRSQDKKDYIVQPAETVSLKGPGKLVLEAVADSCVAIRSCSPASLAPPHVVHTVGQKIGALWERVIVHAVGNRHRTPGERISLSMYESTEARR